MPSPLLSYPNVGRQLPLHLLFIFILSLLLLIPKIFFDLVLEDRQLLQYSAVESITAAWSPDQAIAPPVLIFAGMRHSTNDEGKLVTENVPLYLLPDETAVQAELQGQERQRGIYHATLYSAEITLTGKFDLSRLREGLRDPAMSGIELISLSPLMAFPLREAAGIAEVHELIINGMAVKPQPGQPLYGDGRYDSFAAALPQSAYEDELSFSCRYTLRGSLNFALQMLGSNFKAEISGTALTPSFYGRFLPGKSSTAGPDFHASYSVTSLASGYAALYADSLPNKTDVSVSIQQERQHYGYIERLSKYALFFIALTFVTVLAFELALGTLVSLVQYAVTGGGIIVFYIVLLAFSEHCSFPIAYTVGALSLSIMTGLYMKAVFRSWKCGGAVLTIMLALYLILYAIVNAENYALLIGSCLLTVMLGVIMFLTRRLNQKTA